MVVAIVSIQLCCPLVFNKKCKGHKMVRERDASVKNGASLRKPRSTAHGRGKQTCAARKVFSVINYNKQVAFPFKYSIQMLTPVQLAVVGQRQSRSW